MSQQTSDKGLSKTAVIMIVISGCLVLCLGSILTIRLLYVGLVREANGRQTKFTITGAVYGYRSKYGYWPVSLDQMISKANPSGKEHLIKVREKQNLKLDIESSKSDKEFRARIFLRRSGAVERIKLDLSRPDNMARYRQLYYDPQEPLDRDIRER